MGMVIDKRVIIMLAWSVSGQSTDNKHSLCGYMATSLLLIGQETDKKDADN